jgi:hypothetical protein
MTFLIDLLFFFGSSHPMAPQNSQHATKLSVARNELSVARNELSVARKLVLPY